ncbi:putative DNA binding domain-containing protein [Clostridium estertheticum]|uniref:RNA-binding domain-containing protein n=1 Tax=Clostridium estertheticum TaxID=238834 RepID=UPI001C7C9DB0|nr:RNA-binding domain-containing protein [Clostridium estertheticum]MBX4261075.1 putative DNA binding domain-containing protein [Clostridium estertheticum]WLC69524.1 putative DNA binding domain-containing protein [Clostridium estertheticum]
MTQNELMEIINNGENSYIEFKEENIKAKDLAEEIVAFANSEGGIILIGIDDDGNIIGVKDNSIEEKIMNICRNNCIPNIIPIYNEFVLSDKRVSVVNISKGLNKPYYTVDHKYYIRVGTTKRIASREELLRLFEANGALHFDISPIEATSIKDLNIDIIRDYFINYNTFDLYEEEKEAIERILINADILKEKDGKAVCSVGGILMFGKNSEKYLPQNGVSFAHFKGNDITDELIDKKVILGRIQDIAEQLLVVLKNNMVTSSKINGLLRVEKDEYPILVLREAIINSLVHRNYSIYGSKIRIFMFDDRIEFHSPGRLPNTVTIEKMKIGVSYARNPFLVKYMENMRYIDQLGRGIPMILKTMKNKGTREPLLEEVGEEFILTIFK